MTQMQGPEKSAQETTAQEETAWDSATRPWEVLAQISLVAKFPMGQVYLTQGAAAALEKAETDFLFLLLRHGSCDWGELCQEDKQANDDALTNGDRILSAYKFPNSDEKLWVITEADRSSTTLLLPDEY